MGPICKSHWPLPRWHTHPAQRCCPRVTQFLSLKLYKLTVPFVEKSSYFHCNRLGNDYKYFIYINIWTYLLKSGGSTVISWAISLYAVLCPLPVMASEGHSFSDVNMPKHGHACSIPLPHFQPL